MKIFFRILAVLAILTAALGESKLARARASISPEIIDPRLRQTLRSLTAGNMLTVIVTLRQQANLTQITGVNRAARLQEVIRALQATASAAQRPLIELLENRRQQGLVQSYQPLWVQDAISVTATQAVIDELARRPEVEAIFPDSLPIVPDLAAPEPNISRVNAPALWNLGFTGQGVVVASLDSGVDAAHPDLAGRWRGGTNSWFDPYGQHPLAPTDLSGHGTETMGIIVGGDTGGTTIGMAPGAQWIAARIFNDQGSSTATAIHQAFQWLLDPDGNPTTADAPQVVNNSWSFANPGCYLDFDTDLQALRAAGILPVFAAGNGGPSSGTSYSPANNPSAFAVGAVNSTDQIYAYSSRGPSTCGGRTGPFPQLVAPGVSVRTSGLYGLYDSATGTSLAAPHVSGALALLLSARPNLAAVDQESALTRSAVDLGTSGPDDIYGFGRLDVLAAYNWLLANPASTPTPIPTATATFTPTPTPTYTPTPTATPTVPPSLFSDGFESGSFAAWSSTAANGGRLSVTAQAALAGAYGMQGTISNTTDMYVQDNTPAAEPAYHARFYFAAKTASLSSGKYHDILIGHDSSGKTIFHIQLGRTTSGLAVRLLALNGKSDGSTAWIAIDSAAHPIEVAWQSATSATGKDGSAQLYINGSLAASLTGLSNGSLRLEDVRLGPQKIPSGTSGSEYFDAFVSTRGSVIGP